MRISHVVTIFTFRLLYRQNLKSNLPESPDWLKSLARSSILFVSSSILPIKVWHICQIIINISSTAPSALIGHVAVQKYDMTSKTLTAPSYPTPPTFPPSSSPRVWLITSASSPIGIAVARAILDHGDSVVLGLPQPIDGVDISGSLGNGWTGRDPNALLRGEEERNAAFRAFWAEVGATPALDRCKVVGLDGR